MAIQVGLQYSETVITVLETFSRIEMLREVFFHWADIAGWGSDVKFRQP